MQYRTQVRVLPSYVDTVRDQILDRYLVKYYDRYPGKPEVEEVWLARTPLLKVLLLARGDDRDDNREPRALPE